MEWMRAHPYAVACGVAGLLIVVGGYIVQRKTAASPQKPLTVWGGDGQPLLNPTSYTENPVLAAQEQPLGDGGISPVYLAPTLTTNQDTGEVVNGFDFDTFIASLSQPKSSSGGAGTSAEVNLAYSFIPQGIIATSAPAKKRTKAQDALYEYGNEVGSYIQTYEESNRNAPISLRNQIEDRHDPGKIQQVLLVAAGMKTLGQSMNDMETVPAGVAALHKALAADFIVLADKLSQVPKAESDQTLLSAINAYNAAADKYASDYVGLATTFSLSGIVFSPEDPGSVFTFSGGGSF